MDRHLLGLTLVLALSACGSSHDTDAGVTGFGAPCAAGEVCAAGLLCLEDESFPGGYCTQICSDTPCPDGSECVDTTSPPLCLGLCDGADDCRDGYQCWRGTCRPLCDDDGDCGAGGSCGAGGICEPAMCTTADDCGPGQACRSGQCVESIGDAGNLLPHGSPCTDPSECEGGVCLAAENGGVCSLPCTQAEDCFEFDVEAGCGAPPTDTNGDGTPDAAPQVCVLSPPASLGLGQFCTSDVGCVARICQEGQCTEVCDDDGDCLAGQVCTTMPRAGAGGATFMGCGYPAVGGGGVQTVELGEVTLGAGFGERFTIATAPDTVSLTLEIEDLDQAEDVDLAFISVFDPQATQLYDINDIAMLQDTPIRWLPADTTETATMLIPNTTPDRVDFLPGAHNFTVAPLPRFMGDSLMTRLRVVARVKRAPGGVQSNGTLDLNIHIVTGISGLSAASAPGNSRLQNALTNLRAVLAPTGVTLGTIRYVDVNQPSLTVIDSTDGPDSELSTLFRAGGSTLGGEALDVFIVRTINSGGGGFRALGIAGGIPGPANIHGSRHSGVVTSWNGLGSGATGDRVLGQILAHEIGHYIGLFHVTERLRPCSPGEDPSAGCAPFGGGDQLADTTRGDTSNLMHWSIVGGGTNTNLTAGQGFVYRAAALVRP